MASIFNGVICIETGSRKTWLMYASEMGVGSLWHVFVVCNWPGLRVIVLLVYKMHFKCFIKNITSSMCVKIKTAYALCLLHNILKIISICCLRFWLCYRCEFHTPLAIVHQFYIYNSSNTFIWKYPNNIYKILFNSCFILTYLFTVLMRGIQSLHKSLKYRFYLFID